MTDQREPVDPLTELAAAAAQTHELFVSLMAAGFAHFEALWLTAALVKGVSPPPGWEAPGG